MGSERLRRSRWLLVVLALVAVLAGVIVVVRSGGEDVSVAQPAVPAQPTQTAPTAESWQQRADREQLEEHLAEFGSGYDCGDANIGAVNVRQLKLCPDYVASVTIKDGKHVIDQVSLDGDGRPIKLDVEAFQSCGNDGVEGVPIRCHDMWRIRWTVADGYVALGYNQQMAPGVMYRPDGSTWVGPLMFGEMTGDQLVDVKTVTIEVYASNPKVSTSPEPLSEDRHRPRF